MFKILSHVLLFLSSGLILWYANPGESLFSYHPSAMILGMLLLTSEGILQFRQITPKWRVTLHGLIEGLGLTLGYIGFYAIYTNKNETRKSHFTTWHGLFGFLTIILLTLQATGGILAKYGYTRIVSNMLKSMKMNTSLVKKGHRLNGTLSMCLIFVTLTLALYSNWFSAIVAEFPIIWWLPFITNSYVLAHILYNQIFERENQMQAPSSSQKKR